MTSESETNDARSSESPCGTLHLALSKQESILLSSAGDLLVSRCRHADLPVVMNVAQPLPEPQPYVWNEEVLAMACCDSNVNCDDLSTAAQDTALCGTTPWKADNKRTRNGSGLFGGSPVAVAHQQHPLSTQNARYAHEPTLRQPPITTPFRSEPIDDATINGCFDEESIVPIRSFDYSYLDPTELLPIPDENDNPATASNNHMGTVAATTTTIAMPVTFMHGIPSFHVDLGQGVKICQVSAHPLGSHVLLIANSGLLYSYGLNDYGQLGLGTRASVHVHRGYVTSPTIVTPLAEHGGKVILVAAGVSHSLVCVETEEGRLVKERSVQERTVSTMADLDDVTQASSFSNDNVTLHHQVYGFGRNNFAKLGLVSPRVTSSTDEMECVVLPRRVALRCKKTPLQTKCGVVCLAASAEHSAAILRKQNGDVELYTWGNSMYNALGPCNMNTRVVPVPSYVSCLSHAEEATSRLDDNSILQAGEFPTDVALGARCTMVTTSRGRCFAFGVSEEGQLGLGPCVTEAPEPREVTLPHVHERYARVSVGACHVVAVTQTGRVYAWGAKDAAGIGEHNRDGNSTVASSIANGSNTVASKSTSNGPAAPPLQIAWQPEIVELPREKDYMHIVQACAGLDTTLFVSDTGRVLSCGLASGRLCRGETAAPVVRPEPIFGGLRLWRQAASCPWPLTLPSKSFSRDESDASSGKEHERRSKPPLKRGMTMS